MTDYLELTWADQANALLEQARWLERILSRLATGIPAEESGTAKLELAEREQVSHGAVERTAALSSWAEFSARESEEGTFSLNGSRRRPPTSLLERKETEASVEPTGPEGQSNRAKGAYALEEQLSRLDRAARLVDGPLRMGGRPGGGIHSASRRPVGRADLGGASGRGLPGEGLESDWGKAAVGEGGLPYGRSGPGAWEETRWAEQADRVFRRDSRRYDGGFYLY